MLIWNNNTPFETEITIHGAFRILSSSVPYTSTIATVPAWPKWFLEWVWILWHGPLCGGMTVVVEPWGTVSIDLHSTEYTQATIGLSDGKTQWTKHAPGVYEWNACGATVDITCNPGNAVMKRQRRGPVVAGDIPLNLVIESTNETWEVMEAPITRVQYSPTFDYDYYSGQ